MRQTYFATDYLCNLLRRYVCDVTGKSGFTAYPYLVTPAYLEFKKTHFFARSSLHFINCIICICFVVPPRSSCHPHPHPYPHHKAGTVR